MATLHLHIGHFAGALPRANRLRKRRDRHLRAVRPNYRNELWYRSQLKAIVDQLRAAGADVVSALRALWPGDVETGDRRRATDKRRVAGPVGEHVAAAREKFRNIGGVAVEIAVGTHSRDGLIKRNLDAVDERLAATVKRSVGIEIRQALTAHGPVAEEMDRATEANVALITSIPEQYFDSVQDAVSDAWTGGDGIDDLADAIEHIGDVTESRAALIARDQTSKMNSAFNRVRQTSIGIERYEWQTAEDEYVRDSHDALDGRAFSWDDPPTVDGEVANPGEPINCRCVASPLLDLDDDSLAGAAALESDEDAAEAA